MAWAQRWHRALIHGVLVALAIAMLPWIGMTLWLLVLISIGSIAHPLIHHRVWHYLAREIRTWLRRQW